MCRCRPSTETGGPTPTYVGTVRFTSSDPAATLPPDYTFTPPDNGFKSFSNAVTLRTPTAQTVSATDTANANLRGDSFPSLVIGNGVTHFQVFISDGITVGEHVRVSIRALDNGGVTDTSYRGTVHFTTTDPSAVVPPDYTFTAGDNGVHSFPAASGVKFQTAGTQSIRAADTTKPNLRGDSNPVSVSPAVTTTLTVSSNASSVTAGQASSFEVRAVNDNGIQQTGYRGTVHFTSTDPNATLPADYTFTAADNGRHFFSSGVTYNSPGAQRISVTDTTTATLRADGNQTVVYATVAKFLNVSVSDSNVTSGQPTGIRVTAVNEGNVTVAGYRGTIRFSSSDQAAGLPPDYTFTAADNGTHFFTPGVTYVTPGSQQVHVVDTSNGSLRGDSNPSLVYPDTAKQIHVDVFDDGETGTIGKQYDVRVRILNENQFSDPVAGYRGTIHFTSTDPSATLPADYTFTADDAGEHTFEDVVGEVLRFGTAGVQRVSVNDTANANLRGDATQTFVYSAAATYLGFNMPSSTAVGASNTITVSALNTDDQVNTGYRGTVQFSSSDTAAGLPANYTFTAADNGQKAFTVTWNSTGTQSLRIQDVAAPLLRGEANTRVTGGTGFRLSVFGGGTAGNKSTVNMPQSIQVQALTATGGTDTGYRGTVHFTSTDPNAVLPPHYIFTAADNGFHTFSGGLNVKTTGVQIVQVTEGSRFASNAPADGRQCGHPLRTPCVEPHRHGRHDRRFGRSSQRHRRRTPVHGHDPLHVHRSGRHGATGLHVHRRPTAAITSRR